MNLFAIYREHLLTVARGVWPEAVVDAITLEPPRDEAYGDMATNAAMVLAGQMVQFPPPAPPASGGSEEKAVGGASEELSPPQAGGTKGGSEEKGGGGASEVLSSPRAGGTKGGSEEKAGGGTSEVLSPPQAGGTKGGNAKAKPNPRQIAEALLPSIKALPGVTQANIAGPGFINLTLAPDIWRGVLPVILTNGVAFGNSPLGAGEKVNVEYVSANPTGPMHVGHARGAVVGDALGNLLAKAGYHVTREYYINDAGAQVEKVARSAYLRYREACGEAIGEIPEGLYPGEYMKHAGTAIRAAHGEKLMHAAEAEWLPVCRDIALAEMMKMIKEDLADLGIHHEVFTSEAALLKAGKIEAAIEILRGYDLMYRGVLEPPKGKKPEDWEPREQLLLRSTTYGDDTDRAVLKSDGTYAYIAGDLALAADKLARGFNHQILVLGADHGGYVKRLQAAVKALSGGSASCQVILCQLVHLFQNGEPFKMSKRAGTFITVRDVLEEVGKDILRFVMLMRKSDMVMEFDLEKVKEQSKDNPVFYVQYAHARCYSLLRLAEAQMPAALAASATLDAAALAPLTHPAELALIKRLAVWPRAVEQAALAYEPHRIIYYLQELAGAFHGLWNSGQQESGLRFIRPEDAPTTTARLALARAVALVLASGLAVCGVTPVKELRE